MREMLGNQRGFTLVEVVVAIAVIGIGLVALASTVPLSAYGIQEGSQVSSATFLANARLEQVKAARWVTSAIPNEDQIGVSASASAAPQAGGVTTFPDESPMAAPHTQYSRTVRVTSCAAGCAGVADAQLRQVTVTVTYRPLTGIGQAAVGSTKAVAVTTYVAAR